MLVERHAPARPRTLTVVPAPVPACASRELAVLHPAEAGRYTALVAAVAAEVEARLSPAVAANRVASASMHPPIVRLQPWRSERAAFADRLRRLAGSGSGLLFADVLRCYPSIAPGVAEAALIRLRCDAGAASAVRAFLLRLAERGIMGLPVGPDPSAVLANAVLERVDEDLQAAGLCHARWVDDVVVAVRGRKHAEGVLALIRRALEPLGLELNEAKTRFVLDPAAIDAVGAVSPARAGARLG